jgi:hypothetical protein
MKLIEQILDNFQEVSFVKDLKQQFYNKNDNNICDLDESKGLQRFLLCFTKTNTIHVLQTHTNI